MSAERVLTLVGGVSELYQGDLDVGRRVAERLQAEELGHGVTVEDLHYGAVAVAQRLQELEPDCLVLVGAVQRGRPPGGPYRRLVVVDEETSADFQAAVGDAVTGYVGIDLIIEVGAGLGALPARVVAIEIEPALVAPTEELSAEVAASVDDVIGAVRREVEHAPLFTVVAELEGRVGDGHLEPSAATELLEAVLAELRRADRDGRWGATFGLRDELVAELRGGHTSESMDHADWGLVWGLVEELTRLEKQEAARIAVDQSPDGSRRPSP